MNTNLFSVSCDQFNLGTTFIIWSIHYVTGQTEFYSLDKDRIDMIPENPLRNGTAHSMEPNEISLITNIEDSIARLKDNCSLNHFRFMPKSKSLAEFSQLTAEFQNVISKRKIKVISVTSERLQGLIGFLRHNTEDLSWQKDFDKVKKYCCKYWPSFMSNSHIFPNKLSTWHEIRENIAFHIRPYDHWREPTLVENNVENIYTCKFRSFLFDPEKEIQRILKFLCLPSTERIKQWLVFHQRWLENIGHYIIFCDDIDKIIMHILNGQDMDLSKYKMNVLKEAILLHFLMYKHDLNLHKEAQVLPTNTKYIHELLKKNDRCGIENLYN